MAPEPVTGWLVLSVAACLVAFAPLPPWIVDRLYARDMYPWLQTWLTTTTNLLPIAVLDVAILAAVILTAPGDVSRGPQLFVGGLLLVLVGSLLGFLWHNRPPARLFMGDAGSYLVGYLMATATISATFAITGSASPKVALVQSGMGMVTPNTCTWKGSSSMQ